MENDGHSLAPLDWWHVGEASVFVLLAAIISFIMGTGLEISLIIASIRCVIQLTMMGYVLDDVLKADNVGVVILMSFTLVLLGAYEAAFNRARKTFNGMFVSMLCILLISNVFVGFIGSAFALQEKPFWKPTKFIPIIGMLLGNTMGTIAMATEQCLDNICVHAPLLEARLAFGASRYEAAKPLAINAIRVSVIPIITQLSVMGLINIPGMMTGQLMAGTPMMDAVIYQQCIMFMIAASSTLGAIMAVVTCLVVLIDSHHTLRFDRIHEQRSLIPRKLVLRAQAFLQRKLLELRHHTKTLAKTTRHRRWQRVRTEEEIELE